MKTLKQGSEGVEVKRWQLFLLANDFDLGPRKADEDFGFFTVNATERLQEKFGLKVDGVVGPEMWAFAQLHSFGRIGGPAGNLIKPAIKPVIGELPIDAEGYQFILEFEVGGGKKYYDAQLQCPTLPGGYSGITIGVGYDLRYNTVSKFDEYWAKYLKPEDAKRLRAYCGKAADKYDVQRLRDIMIPWEIAEKIYQEDTIPRFWALTQNTFPGVELLCPAGRAALLSLVFNRGQGLEGSKRGQMRLIRQILKNAKAQGDLLDNEIKQIAAALRDMISIWTGMNIFNGMKRRRNGEADMVMLCA